MATRTRFPALEAKISARIRADVEAVPKRKAPLAVRREAERAHKINVGRWHVRQFPAHVQARIRADVLAVITERRKNGTAPTEIMGQMADYPQDAAGYYDIPPGLLSDDAVWEAANTYWA